MKYLIQTFFFLISIAKQALFKYYTKLTEMMVAKKRRNKSYNIEGGGNGSECFKCAEVYKWIRIMELNVRVLH